LGARARRILSGLSFSRQALSVASQTRPTLVHANDWNTMWTGMAIKLRYGARLVYDSHELWPDRNGRWEWRPWLLAGEALFVRAADEVITSSPGYADALASRYCIVRPFVVRNIPERSLRAGSMPAHSEIEGPSSPPRVVYVGGLMPGRGLEQMIDALPLIPDVRLRAIGPGAPRYRAGLLDRARAALVEDRVELRAPVAPGEVQSALAGAAAGLCLIQPVCRSYELSLPNKLFEYAAAGVPVLASDVPVIAAIVRGEGLGEVVPAGCPRAIAASLERLLAPHGWRLAAERARAFADAHDWPGEACTLAGVYRRAGSGIAA
jgi:glycosyltransferase involved in cell wall biosynthesis